MLINSKAVMDYIKATKADYILNKEKFKELLEGKEPPYDVSFKFIRGTRHKFDYINPCQTVQDLMVKSGWIEDDNCTWIVTHFEEYEYNKEEPGVIIKVL